MARNHQTRRSLRVVATVLAFWAAVTMRFAVHTYLPTARASSIIGETPAALPAWVPPGGPPVPLVAPAPAEAPAKGPGSTHQSSRTVELSNCSWQHQNEALSVEQGVAQVHDRLSDVYESLWSHGVHPGPLFNGQSLSLYLRGTLNQHDSDIDVCRPIGVDSDQAVKSAKHVYGKMRPSLSLDNCGPDWAFKIEKNGTRKKANMAQYGECRYILPNGRPIVCMERSLDFLKTTYGHSWWVPHLPMKQSILYFETKAKWVDPVKRAILKYDQDGNGLISAFEIAPFGRTIHYQASIEEIDAAVAELNGILEIVVT